MLYQEVLTMETMSDSFRSECQGWSLESGLVAHHAIIMHGNHCEVWKIGGITNAVHCYPTPLHAMGHGFKLLTPPIKFEQELDIDASSIKEMNKYGITQPGKQMVAFYEWWFVRDINKQ